MNEFPWLFLIYVDSFLIFYWIKPNFLAIQFLSISLNAISNDKRENN